VVHAERATMRPPSIRVSRIDGLLAVPTMPTMVRTPPAASTSLAVFARAHAAPFSPGRT